MPHFSALDGTSLAFHVSGDGEPVVCIPGGPMLDSTYLGDLGGLGRHRRLVLLDPRGTGASATPEDSASYRCDRQVEDVEALRSHLGHDRIDLLGHSAGTNIAVQYAQRHPDRVRRLVLVTPSAMAVGVVVTPETRLELARLRADQPWFPEAFRALEAVVATGAAGPGTREALEPFWHGRWDEHAQAVHAAQEARRDDALAAAFAADGAFTPEETRRALADFPRPVLVLAGEVDVNSPPSAMQEVARIFPEGRLVVQSAAGHYPWQDDPDAFAATVEAFLS